MTIADDIIKIARTKELQTQIDELRAELKNLKENYQDFLRGMAKV